MPHCFVTLYFLIVTLGHRATGREPVLRIRSVAGKASRKISSRRSTCSGVVAKGGALVTLYSADQP